MRMGGKMMVNAKHREHALRKVKNVSKALLVPVDTPSAGAPIGGLTASEQRLARTKSHVDKRHPFYGKRKAVLAYLLYLISFLMASLFARPTVNIFQQNSVIQNIFGLDQMSKGTSFVYNEILTQQDWWEWMGTRFADGLMRKELQPGRNEGAVLELLTGVQIRQIRVKPVPCGGQIFRSAEAMRCFPTFADGVEDTAPFGTNRQWTWSPASAVSGYDHGMPGHFGVYGTAGYIVKNVSTTATELRTLLAELEAGDWLTAQTRAVIIDVNVWNPSQRLISAVKIQAEFTTVGRVIPHFVVKTFEYKEWIDTGRGYWYWEILFFVMVMIYAVDEAHELIVTMNGRRSQMQEKAKAHGHNMAASHLKSLVRADHLLDAYFEDPWNIMDALNYTMALVVIAIEVQARLQLHNAVDLINEQHTNLTSAGTAVVSREDFFSMFVSVYGPGYLSELAYSMMGVNAVITWLKLLKYLNSFPHLAMLSKTLTNAFHPVRDFSIMFFIVFLSSGQAFNMAFGTHLANYSTPESAMMSLFRALLGDFEYFDLTNTDPVAGPLLFIIYILLVGFILLNMFIAILSEAYGKAKVEVFGDLQVERADEWRGAVGLVEYINLSVRSVLHHTLELPFQILRHGSDQGRAVYNANKPDAPRDVEVARNGPVTCEDEDDSMGDELETPHGGGVDEESEKRKWSQMTAMKEILRLNRELVSRMGPMEQYRGGTGGATGTRGNDGAGGAGSGSGSGSESGSGLTPEELRRSVTEIQGIVGVSSPPLPSLKGKGKVEQLVPRAPMRSMPRSMPPIPHPTAVVEDNNGRDSPPILKRSGGPIVSEDAKGIEFSDETIEVRADFPLKNDDG